MFILLLTQLYCVVTGINYSKLYKAVCDILTSDRNFKNQQQTSL